MNKQNQRPNQTAVRALATMAMVSATMLFAVPSVFAATGGGNSSTAAVAKHEPSLVALGDSVTFGYNLSDTNNNTLPSASAYPALMGQADHLKLSNLGIPGWTSTDLVNALSSPNFQQAIAGANVIVIDIGSNDLLGPAAQMGLLNSGATSSSTPITITAAEQQAFTTAVTNYGKNLATIVGTVRKLTQAPILLYNLYNPFPAGTGLGTVTTQLEAPMNDIVAKVSTSVPDVYLVDANQAFSGNQLTYVRLANQDVHPTPAGQGVLAKVGEQALQPLLAAVDKSAKGLTAGPTTLVVQPVAATGGTVRATLGLSLIALDIPSGVLNQSSEVDVTSDVNDVSKLAPKGTSAVASFAVNFAAGTQLTGPYQATVLNSAIPSTAAVYQISAGKLTPVLGATVAKGKVSFPATAGGEFVVLSPAHKSVANATKPVTGLPMRGEGLLAGGLVAMGALLLWRSRRFGSKNQ